jgi:hypothetical protein
VIETIVDNWDELGIIIKRWAYHWGSEFLVDAEALG